MVIILLQVLAVAVLMTLPFGRQSYQGPRASDDDPAFDGARAWEDVRTLAVRFPRRWSGGPDRQAAADWLAGVLEDTGLDIHRETFPAALGEPAPVTLENIWGVSRGSERPDEIVVALGNYDMAPTSFQAASDTAGHVGTLLELARLIHASPHRRTFVFFFPDGEEWGMLGARRFAQTFPDRARIVAALSIEDLDPGKLRALGIDGIGQFRGYAPMWLRSLAADAAARERYATDDVPPFFEWLQRSVLVSFTDQGPFLGAGIPAIDLAGRGEDQTLHNAVYHLPTDTIEKMQPEAVLAYGRIQERIVRAIDSMPEVPRESSFYLRLDPHRVVPGWWLAFAQLLVFAPLAAVTLVRARRQLTQNLLMRETKVFGTVLAVLLIWIAAIKLLPVLGLMPRYELYPPPPRHPLLTTVLWVPVGVGLALMVAMGWIARRFLRAVRWSSHPHRTEGVTTMLVWLLVLSGVALVDNPFAAVTFMLLPASLWVSIHPAAGHLRRIFNAILVIAGFAVVFLLFMQYAANLRIGWYILWYVFMAVAYGQFTPLRIALAFMMLAIALRLLAHGTLEGGARARV